MTVTGQESTIEAPHAPRRRWGLLIDVAAELTLPPRPVVTDGVESMERPPLPVEQVGRGVTFAPLGCDGLENIAVEFCDDSAAEDDLVAPDGPVFEAFSIRTTESCSALDVDLAWLNGRIARRWETMVSASLAAELAQGGASGTSPTLASSADILTTTAAEIEAFLGLLELGLAQKLHGGAGIIHLPPEAFSALSWKLEQVEGQWYTRSGHVVVADGGYTALLPEGEDLDPTVGWGYASGPVGYKLGKPYMTDQDANEYLDRTTNIIHGRKIANAVVAFDPCAVVAVPFVQPAEIPGS